MSDRIRGHLRAVVLAALSEGPAHGYAVTAQIRERTSGSIALREGSLYPALHRLEAEGLVASSWDDEAGRRRRLYSLTPAGKEALRDEIDDWHTFRDAMNAALEGATS